MNDDQLADKIQENLAWLKPVMRRFEGSNIIVASYSTPAQFVEQFEGDLLPEGVSVKYIHGADGETAAPNAVRVSSQPVILAL